MPCFKNLKLADWAATWSTARLSLAKAEETQRVACGDGAGTRDRTPDPLITSQVLYHLSYTGATRGPVAGVRRERNPGGTVHHAWSDRSGKAPLPSVGRANRTQP